MSDLTEVITQAQPAAPFVRTWEDAPDTPHPHVTDEWAYQAGWTAAAEAILEAANAAEAELDLHVQHKRRDTAVGIGAAYVVGAVAARVRLGHLQNGDIEW